MNAEMMEELLDDLWLCTIQELIVKIKEGNAAPTDIGNAIKMLRDNGIVVNTRKGKGSLEDLIASMSQQTGQDPSKYLDGNGKLAIDVIDPDESEVQ
jgi:hypothetical protein